MWINQIKKCIEIKLNKGYKDFIIFPFGEMGLLVKRILNEAYGIQEKYILDNHLCKYNSQMGGYQCLTTLSIKDVV